jgi:hypothetical protein
MIGWAFGLNLVDRREIQEAFGPSGWSNRDVGYVFGRIERSEPSETERLRTKPRRGDREAGMVFGPFKWSGRSEERLRTIGA